MKLSWMQWLPFRSWRIVGTVEYADEIPERLPARAMVVVASGGPPKWVGFRCPCGRKHNILLNLDGARQPAWRLFGNGKGRYSIMPSIDYHDAGRRCHFFLRDNHIIWAKDRIR